MLKEVFIMKIDFEVLNHISKLKIENFNRMFHAGLDLNYEGHIAIHYSQIGEIKALFDIAELLTGYVFNYSDLIDYLNSGKATSINDFIEKRGIKTHDH